jgi:glycosyltransferase involved in cell wall biosynthesis
MTKQHSPIDVSVIIPIGRRVDTLSDLIGEYDAAVSASDLSYELIVVLDGPKEQYVDHLNALAADNDRIRLIQLAREFGESAALAAGFAAARGDGILTLPAYYQVEADEITRLLNLDRDGANMLIAVRPRPGMSFDKLRRRAFHALFRFTSGMKFNDLGCGVRLFDRVIGEEISLYGDQHRFFPALARQRGFRVREVELNQSPKDVFQGRYRVREYLHRLLDVLTVFFLVRFTKKPLRFFGTLGFVAAAIGALLVFVFIIQRLFFDVPLADRPALLLASLLIVLGVQTFALGLIGELIIFTHASKIKEYAVNRVIVRSTVDETSSTANDADAGVEMDSSSGIKERA